MCNIRAQACNTIQHIAAREGGTLASEASLRWSTIFLEIANLADEALADAPPAAERGFGT